MKPIYIMIIITTITIAFAIGDISGTNSIFDNKIQPTKNISLTLNLSQRQVLDNAKVDTFVIGRVRQYGDSCRFNMKYSNGWGDSSTYAGKFNCSGMKELDIITMRDDLSKQRITRIVDKFTALERIPIYGEITTIEIN